MKKLILGIFTLALLAGTSSLTLAEGKVKFCVIFPDGKVGSCADTLSNCEIGNRFFY
jgi:hypothetical protein